MAPAAPISTRTGTIRFISSHFGYSYGQNLTTTNVPHLSWSSRGGSPAVYINDVSLFFPGLALSLTGAGGCSGTETFLTTEVHKYLNYIAVLNARQNGSPYLPQWGTGNECTGTTIGQASYSFTNLN